MKAWTGSQTTLQTPSNAGTAYAQAVPGERVSKPAGVVCGSLAHSVAAAFVTALQLSVAVPAALCNRFLATVEGWLINCKPLAFSGLYAGWPTYLHRLGSEKASRAGVLNLLQQATTSNVGFSLAYPQALLCVYQLQALATAALSF